MEVNPDRKVECEKGGDADARDRMEAGGQSERDVKLEAIEVYPTPSGKREQLYKTHEKQFLVFCPAEIWTMILGKLKNDPGAQTNCANASPYFYELLKKDRILFLFQKVVEVIAPKANKREFGMYVEMAEDGDDKEVEDYFWPKEDGQVWRASILGWRLVCSAWNNAAEHCYESFEMAGQPELLLEKDLDPRSPVKRMGRRWTEGLFRFRCVAVIQHFLKEFEFLHFFNPTIDGPPKNPFFGRCILIEVTRQLDFNARMAHLLQLFGNQVWYCVILWPTWVLARELSTELVKWLGLMPNLKTLGMEGPSNVGGLTRKEFQLNQIPKLEKLEILEFKKINGLILSEMLRVNCHVKVLIMKEVDSGVDLNVGRLLTNLKVFLPIYSQSGHKMLDQVGHHWKQLSRLHLDGGSKYFGKLETNWAQSLTELELIHPFGVGMSAGMRKATVLKESKNLRLNLPGIRRLTLAICGLLCLDFIEPMQGSLEHLELKDIIFNGNKRGCKQRVKKQQSIELIGFEEKMHKSNIWNSFGKLETVKIVNFRNETKFFIFSKEGKKYLCLSENEHNLIDDASGEICNVV